MSFRIANAVRTKIEARAARERRKVGALLTLLVEDAMDGLDRSTTAASPESKADLTGITGAEAEYLAALDKALAVSGIDLGDGRRVVRHSVLRATSAEMRGGAYVHLGSPRKLLEARKVLSSDDTHVWRI